MYLVHIQDYSALKKGNLVVANFFLLTTDSAATQRLEMLKRWKENKLLQKEKEKREKERKGVFKVGLFHPKDTFSLKLPAATAGRTREVRGHLKPDICMSIVTIMIFVTLRPWRRSCL